MIYIKKLIFALPFLLAVVAFAWQIEPFLKDFSLIFSLNSNLFYQLLWLVITFAGSTYLFTVFAVLALDWMSVLPVIVLACCSPLLFVSAPVSYFLAIGLFIAFIISFALTYNKVTKDSADFNVSGDVIKPSASLLTLIILTISVAFYFSVATDSDKIIQKIIDSAVNISSGMMKTQQLPQDAETSSMSILPISPDQIQLLRDNPDLLEQAGLDPAILDQVEKQGDKKMTAQDLAIEAAKPMITKQINDLLQPLMPFIPFLITFIFYLNLQFLASIAAFFLSPLIYLLFWVLHKINFIHFELETREVKKLVI